jgi:hypothetical protein
MYQMTKVPVIDKYVFPDFCVACCYMFSFYLAAVSLLILLLFLILMVHICVHAVKVLAPISVTFCKPLYTSSRITQIFKFSSLEHNRGICKMLCESVQAFNFKCFSIVLLIRVLDFSVLRNIIND